MIDSTPSVDDFAGVRPAAFLGRARTAQSDPTRCRLSDGWTTIWVHLVLVLELFLELIHRIELLAHTRIATCQACEVNRQGLIDEDRDLALRVSPTDWLEPPVRGGWAWPPGSGGRHATRF